MVIALGQAQDERAWFRSRRARRTMNGRSSITLLFNFEEMSKQGQFP